MNQTVLEFLKCPVCGAPLNRDEKVCRCTGAKVHCFDFAKSGYLNLSGPRGGEGDLKDAVRARRLFLDAGYYQPLCDRVDALLTDCGVTSFLDAGCGEGYYTNRLAMHRDGVGIDLSRAGIEVASKRAKAQESRAGFAVASLFSMPVADGAVDGVVNLFAPCAEQEFLRVLKPGGVLLLVGAGERHLMGLKQVLYDDPYLNPGRADLPKSMEQISSERLTYTVTVEGQEQIEALFSMTPYYWRTSEADHAKLKGLERLTTEVDFDILLFRKGQ